MKQRSLRETLSRQWMAFAFTLSLLLLGGLTLCLYILEDFFLDGELDAVAASLAQSSAESVQLPADFSLLATVPLPRDFQKYFDRDVAQRRIGAHAEFRRDGGRYVHVRLIQRQGRPAPELLVFDVTERMRVNTVLARVWPLLLLLTLGFLLLARSLSHWFFSAFANRVNHLMAAVRGSQTPEALRTVAAQEPVQELAELARRNADALQASFSALERERRMLAYLAHELRTPLQSTRTNLEVLAHKHPALSEDPAWQRLQRAATRLERVSHSVRWLAGDEAGAPAPVALRLLLCELVAELSPLAQQKGARFSLAFASEPTWLAPPAVVETLFANLLLNALQHGDAAPVEISVAGDGVRIRNRVAADTDHTGSGLGLQVVREWASKAGLSVNIPAVDDGVYDICVQGPAVND